MGRKLGRIQGRGWLSGVCSGVAYKLGIQAWLVRLFWFITIFPLGRALGDSGFWIYILLWIFLPRWDKTPEDYDEVSG